jgi:N6-adenosine-specific RNA methylase IME4
MTVELVLYNNAKTALEAARTVDEVKDIRDRALAMQVYAKQAGDRELINNATEIRYRAERRAGQMLKQMREDGTRQGPGRPKGSVSLPLKKLGVSKIQSSRWQQLSELPQEDYEKRLAAAQRRVVDALDLTALTPEERAAEKQARRTQLERDLATQIRALPNKRYGLILADPEWKFVPWSEETGSDRSAANHYATSALDAIKKRDVASIAADDCVLALWATVPMLPQALEVLEAWGFDYRSHIVWLKNKTGTGYWFRNVHELLLIGMQGNVPAPAPGTQWESAFDADVGGHSEKPDEAYQMLEAYFPTLPKIELNATKSRNGWDCWGASAPVDLEAESDAAETHTT